MAGMNWALDQCLTFASSGGNVCILGLPSQLIHFTTVTFLEHGHSLVSCHPIIILSYFWSTGETGQDS